MTVPGPSTSGRQSAVIVCAAGPQGALLSCPESDHDLRGDSATEYQQSCSKLAESGSIILIAHSGLEHPSIVPVHGLGTYGDGWPYYALRFVRGASLKEAIKHFHAEAR